MKLVPVVVASLLALGACTETLDPEAPEAKRSAPMPPKASPLDTPLPEPEITTESLVYVRGMKLEAWDPQTEETIVLGKLPGPDAALSPDGQSISVVRDLAPGTDPEGYGEPEISTGPVGGALTPLGPGYSPLWSPDGAELAALTGDGVIVYDLASGEDEIALEGDGWELVGWSSERVAAVGPGGVALADPGREPSFLRLSPAAFWGISPAEPTVLSLDNGARLVDLAGGDDVEASLSTALGDGAWSPDGSRIAVVEIRGGSRLIVVDTATGESIEVPEGKGAQGGVVWSADSQTFAFVRIDPGDRLRLQAVICKVPGGCVPGFSWAQGVILLGFAEV